MSSADIILMHIAVNVQNPGSSCQVKLFSDVQVGQSFSSFNTSYTQLLCFLPQVMPITMTTQQFNFCDVHSHDYSSLSDEQRAMHLQSWRKQFEEVNYTVAVEMAPLDNTTNQTVELSRNSPGVAIFNVTQEMVERGTQVLKIRNSSSTPVNTSVYIFRRKSIQLGCHTTNTIVGQYSRAQVVENFANPSDVKNTEVLHLSVTLKGTVTLSKYSTIPLEAGVWYVLLAMQDRISEPGRNHTYTVELTDTNLPEWWKAALVMSVLPVFSVVL
jgi:hypothetical protein